MTPDFPKALAWCGNSLCVGFKREYYLIKVKITEKTVLPAVIMKTGENCFLLIISSVHEKVCFTQFILRSF